MNRRNSVSFANFPLKIPQNPPFLGKFGYVQDVNYFVIFAIKHQMSSADDTTLVLFLISNNPVKYTDPDGRVDIGWPEWMLQAEYPYTDDLDYWANLAFGCVATKLDFNGVCGGTVRLWRGNYIGSVGAGGELEFFDNNNKRILGADLNKNLGITNIHMQVMDKSGQEIVDINYLTGWANEYDTERSDKPQETSMLAEISFSDSTKAQNFVNDLNVSIDQEGYGIKYKWNDGQQIKVDISNDKKTVTIQWGYN